MVIDSSSGDLSPKYRSFRSSLGLIGEHYALRCDAKVADAKFLELVANVRRAPFKELGEFLPSPFVKGIQPKYLEERTGDSIPVVNTLSIQNLSLNLYSCRHIKRSIFDDVDDSKKLRKGDVLLTVDGGVSIGKPCLFSIGEEMTVDSHVVILRPDGVSSMSLTYLLASPLCQVQFRQAESGASGQTTVTEDDIRRFIVPSRLLENIEEVAREIDGMREQIQAKRSILDQQEEALFEQLSV